MNIEDINEFFNESIEVKRQIVLSNATSALKEMGDKVVVSIINGNKLMLCGNGGSAADAQHLAAEMLVRLKPTNNREGIPAITLAQDTSTITACGNDLGYEFLYERMVSSLGKEGDCLIIITTSGNSKNIIRAINMAKKLGITVFGFLGSGGGDAATLCELSFIVPSYNTARIQESHITAGHALMEYIECELLRLNHICIVE